VDLDWWQPARPHSRRAALYALVALGGLIVASKGDPDWLWQGKFEGHQRDVLLALAGAAALLVAGILAVRAVARGLRAAAGERVGEARGAGLGLVITILGYFIVLLSVLGALQVDLSGLLLGGAFTGVIIGIAAQQTLGNFFAGLVLMIVRPFSIGEQVVLRSSPLGGLFEGEVTDMGLFYVDIVTDRGPAKLPNAGVLAAAIGPGVKDPEEDKAEGQDPAPGPRGGAPAA
jgi:small-conductance mechanosensitive channel